MDVKTNRGLGWRPDLPDARDFRFKALRAVEPVAVLPAKVDLLPEMQDRGIEVFDQGMLGSCVGNSVASLHAYVREVAPRSRLQIYYEARRLIGETNIDAGAYIRDGIKVIANLGAGREVWWKYDESKVFVDPPLTVDRDALLRRIFSYYRLESRSDFRQCLVQGFPFVIGFSVFENFFSAGVQSHGVVPMPDFSREGMYGGHAVMVYGYDTRFRESAWGQEAIRAGANVPNDVYLVRNSWGDTWGRSGDFAVDAAYFENTYLADDAWTVRKAVPQ